MRDRLIIARLRLLLMMRLALSAATLIAGFHVTVGAALTVLPERAD